MLDYLPIYPETRDLVRRHSEAARCRLYEAMMSYAFTGEEPDWPEDALEWFTWEALKQAVDRAQRARESKSRAGKASADSKAQQAATECNTAQQEATETNTVQQEATETNRSQQEPTEANSESECESECESDLEAETPRVRVLCPVDEHTHDNPQQGKRARARAPIWFDPSRPETWVDQSWKSSGRVRCALAQRVVDWAAARGMRMTPTSSGDGAHLVDVMVACMEAGLAPNVFVHLAGTAEDAAEWEDQMLYKLGIQIGSSNMMTRHPDWYDRLLDMGMWQEKQAKA